jgi:hypothetical protein
MSISDQFGWTAVEIRHPIQDRHAIWSDVCAPCRIRAPREGQSVCERQERSSDAGPPMGRTSTLGHKAALPLVHRFGAVASSAPIDRVGGRGYGRRPRPLSRGRKDPMYDSVDASFVLTGHATVRTAEDVCAALMPPG